MRPSRRANSESSAVPEPAQPRGRSTYSANRVTRLPRSYVCTYMTPSTPTLTMPLPLVLRNESLQPADEATGDAHVDNRTAVNIEDLYNKHADEVFGFALWLLGSRDEAAEVVQDSFVRLMISKRPLDTIRSPKAFLLRVARSAAVDRIRKRRPQEPLVEDSLLTASNDNPEARARAAEVARALRSLPNKQREALYLRFFSGLTFAEIARVARIPTFTAASRCRLGLKNLQRRMNRQ